jgi:hypothetical protein
MTLIVRKEFANLPTGSSSGLVPTYIGPSENFEVPVNRQALFAVPIWNDGALIIDGVLAAVD